MEPLHTERLTLRPFTVDDAPTVAAYRNDPSTAEYQSWETPYTLERAIEMLTSIVALDGPTNDSGYSLAIATPDGGVIGDVYIGLEWEGRSAEIGYTLAPGSRGKGFATEAARRVIEYLFDDLGIQRIHAALHPENFDSMAVLERLGFVYEGTARQSYWVGDVCTDDPKFGLLRSDWTSWNERDRTKPAAVELIEVTPANRREVFALATHKSQERFVSPMARSAADALVVDHDDEFGTIVPWFRAIQADGQIAGFVMLAEPTPTMPDPYLWRFLIDRMHQRRGIGWQVLDQLVGRYRALGNTQMYVSWQPGKGGPEPMYLKYGFVPTGRIDDGEIEGVLSL